MEPDAPVVAGKLMYCLLRARFGVDERRARRRSRSDRLFRRRTACCPATRRRRRSARCSQVERFEIVRLSMSAITMPPSPMAAIRLLSFDHIGFPSTQASSPVTIAGDGWPFGQ